MKCSCVAAALTSYRCVPAAVTECVSHEESSKHKHELDSKVVTRHSELTKYIRCWYRSAVHVSVCMWTGWQYSLTPQEHDMAPAAFLSSGQMLAGALLHVIPA